jgi:hypothetical protein
MPIDSAPIDCMPIDGTRMESVEEAAAIAAASFPSSVVSRIS